MKQTNKILPALCLLTLAACGGQNGSNSSPSEMSREEAQVTEGKYKAILRPYNKTLSGWIPNGMVDIKIIGNEIEVKSWLDDSANVTHRQTIHVGTRCPDVEDDTNKDGFVDFHETLTVTKKILIPLDGDLRSLTGGENGYPKGNFDYYQKAPLSDLMNELNQQGLNLAGKVIIVTGVAETRSLPATVSSLPGLTAQLSVPIACGVIERME